MSKPERGVALVTGANRGLGFEAARRLLASGLSVVLTGRDAVALERAQRTLSEPHQRRAMVVQMDVTSTESIAAAQQALMVQGGCVDVLVK